MELVLDRVASEGMGSSERNHGSCADRKKLGKMGEIQRFLMVNNFL